MSSQEILNRTGLLEEIGLLILEPLSHPKGRLKGRHLARVSLKMGVCLEKLEQLEPTFRAEDYLDELALQKWLPVLQRLVDRFPDSPISFPIPGLEPAKPSSVEAVPTGSVEAVPTGSVEAVPTGPRAVISSNYGRRLRELVETLPFTPFSETILHSMQLAEGGDPLALYGEILYLFEGSKFREPVLKPLPSFQFCYRPSYLGRGH